MNSFTLLPLKVKIRKCTSYFPNFSSLLGGISAFLERIFFSQKWGNIFQPNKKKIKKIAAAQLATITETAGPETYVFF